MAVATPVLERNEVKEEKRINYGMPEIPVSDREHNARIKANYAKLINPEIKVDEILGKREVVPVRAREELLLGAVKPAEAQPVSIERKPYLVENARADAAIFRADNPVISKAIRAEIAPAADSDEEENEDLRPTLTTIQYKTANLQNTVEEGKIQNTGVEKRAGLKKQEKILIAVVVSIVVALFALIIINSAIISGINNQISSLQSSLATVKATYSGVSEQVNSITENLVEAVEQFARNNGMVK